MWFRSEYALARVGPRTLAIGGEKGGFLAGTGAARDRSRPENLRPSLRSFPVVERSERHPSRRARTLEPGRMFPPVFNGELLAASELLGFSSRCKTRKSAPGSHGQINQAAAASLLRSGTNRRACFGSRIPICSFTCNTEVDVQGATVQVRFDVPENSARLILQRLARTSTAPTVAEN